MATSGLFIFSLCAFNVVFGASIAKPNIDYDTIVVGLGSAGTTAASTLAAAGKRVLALEAQGRIGGRVNTVKFGNGVVELGAEWIHGEKLSRTYDEAIKNNVTIKSQGHKFMTFRSDASVAGEELMTELLVKGLTIYDESSSSNETGAVGQYITRELLKYFNESKPELLKDEDFVHEFLEFMNLIVDTYEASNDWNDVSVISNYEELEGDQSLSWHTYGYKTFFDILLNKYNNGPGYPTLDIKLNKEVSKISWSGDGVVVTCADGTEYSAKNVIVTVSVGVLRERQSTLFSPSLPADKVAAIERTTMGVMDKIQLTFDTIFWPVEYTFFAFFWNREDKAKIPSEDFWLTKIDGVSTTMGSNNVLTLWCTGDAAKFIETLPEEELKRKSMGLLRKFLGKKFDIPEPTAMMRSTWYSHPYTRGSYTYDDHVIAKYPETRSILAKPVSDSQGVPRVLFAGEATNVNHFGTVHGASETGLREAERILKLKF